MHLTPAHAWSVTLGLTGAAWCFVPELRLLAGATLGIHAAVLAWGVTGIRSGFFGHVFCRGPRNTRDVALTFDDGPDPELTPAVLDLLEEFGAKATFFVVARRAEMYPELVQRMISEGHQIGCHDLEHSPWANFRFGRRMRQDIALARDIIGQITGRPPAWYRPPSGLMNPHVLPSLQALGMCCAGWSRRAVDFGNRSMRSFRRIPRLAEPGAVVLLHDIAPDRQHAEVFLAALRELLNRMRDDGLQCVRVEDIARAPGRLLPGARGGPDGT